MNATDARAVDLCRDYQQQGSAAFVIRTTDSGDTRIIGLQLPGRMVAKMLRDSADAYEAQAEDTYN